jgi:hypothetical protein
VNGDFHNKKVVVTGPRRVHPEDRAVVYATMLDILKDRPHKVVIGGAMGVDTAAFVACAKAKLASQDLAGFYLEVVVPGYLGDTPSEFREALAASHLVVARSVSECMDRAAPKVLLVELGMDVSHPQSFHVAQQRDARARRLERRVRRAPGVPRHQGGRRRDPTCHQRGSAPGHARSSRLRCRVAR